MAGSFSGPFGSKRKKGPLLGPRRVPSGPPRVPSGPRLDWSGPTAGCGRYLKHSSGLWEVPSRDSNRWGGSNIVVQTLLQTG